MCEPSASALGNALLALDSSPLMRTRIARAALAEVRGRTWEAALGRLADGYRAALGDVDAKPGRRAA